MIHNYPLEVTLLRLCWVLSLLHLSSQERVFFADFEVVSLSQGAGLCAAVNGILGLSSCPVYQLRHQVERGDLS